MNKIILTTVIGLMVSFAGLGYAAPVADTNVPTQIEVQQQMSKGVINWQNDANTDIEAVGIGLPPENVPAARARVMARRAAIVDAQRNLLETIKGVQLDAETTMEDLAITSDVVRTQLSGLVKGFRILNEVENPDGSYEVAMYIPMYGEQNSVAAIAVPELTKNVKQEPLLTVNEYETILTKEEFNAARELIYTGVIVDASGLGLEATFSPVIYDINGRAIYGIKNIDYDFAIINGMVAYAGTVQSAAVGSRAGDNPLVVKATAVRGGPNSVNKVNVVVSVEDGDRILLANQASGMLANCAVVFVK